MPDFGRRDGMSFMLGADVSMPPVLPITVGGVTINIVDGTDVRGPLLGLGMPLLPQLLMHTANTQVAPPPPPLPQPTPLAGGLRLHNNLTNLFLLVSQSALPTLSAIMHILDIDDGNGNPEKKNSKNGKLGLNPRAPEFKPRSNFGGVQAKAPICHFYIRGLCMHGGTCRYSHAWPSPQVTPPSVQPSNQLNSQRAIQFLLNAASASCQLPPQITEEIIACQKYNNGTCNDESWPHKLRHFYTEPDDGSGIHKVDSGCIYPAPRARQRTCQVHSKRMLKWEPTTRTWMQATPAAVPLPADKCFTIMTYNVLFDHYMKDHIHSTKRYHALLEVLRESEFDICCLQEVQPAFLRLLLKEEWVRRKYWASAAEECPSLSFSGVVVLSKWPFLDISVHDLPQTCGNISPSVLGHLRLSDQTTVGICSAHLSQSDVEVRTCQLANLLRKIKQEDHVVLLGDFNMHALNPGAEFDDAWVDSHESTPEDGWTLSLSNNPLALRMIENDKREMSDGDDEIKGGRFDIIFIRSRKNKSLKEKLQTVQSSARVGGKDSCSHYLVRRVLRLCSSLNEDPLPLLHKIGIDADDCQLFTETRDPERLNPDSCQSSLSPFSDDLTLRDQLSDAIDALNGIPKYLCPSDHFYVKASLVAAPSVLSES